MWQLDIQSDRDSVRFESTTVGGFHDTRSAARDRGKAGVREFSTELARRIIDRIVFSDPRRTENGHRWAEFGEGVEAGDKLTRDPQDAPWITMGKRRRAFAVVLGPVEQE